MTGTAGRRGRSDAERLALLFAAWLGARAVVLVGGRARALYPYQDDPFELSTFAGWAAALVGDGDGPVPLRDGPWEYPVGAVPLVLAPALLRGAPYALGFAGQALLWDGALLLVLALVGLRRGSLAGAWLWLAAVPLLGPVALARFDVVPTALAVAGLASPPLLGGVLLGAGAVVKLWPALLLPVLLVRPAGRGRVVAGAVGVGAVTLLGAALWGVLPQLLSFLSCQRDRGLEVESLPALPLMLARAAGDERTTVGFGFGSYQVDGPWAPAALALGTTGLAAVLVLTAVLCWRARGAGDVVPLAVLVVAGVLVFDKVLSAQYPLWLTGLVALALCTPGSPLRAAAAPLCGVLLLTQLVYPLSVQDLLAGDWAPVLLLAVRDVLLVVVAVLAGRAAWSTRPPADVVDRPSEDEVPVHVQHRQQAEPAG